MIYLIDNAIFSKLYIQIFFIKPYQTNFTCVQPSVENTCTPTDGNHDAYFWLGINCHKNLIEIKAFVWELLRSKRTRCFCFLNLNFIITLSFLFIRWQLCRSSGSTVIPFKDDDAYDILIVPAHF